MSKEAMTTREMRGMAIANEIGRRNNPDVSIQRLNKLAYKVKSQSNHDKWYTVTKDYSSEWTCDCPDFTFRHLECKHVHAVKFSKLLRKKIYFDTFANIPITESKIGEIICQARIARNLVSDITRIVAIFNDIYAKIVNIDSL
jgi:hypothetical protein